jgi:hypothetical protein
MASIPPRLVLREWPQDPSHFLKNLSLLLSRDLLHQCTPPGGGSMGLIISPIKGPCLFDI